MHNYFFTFIFSVFFPLFKIELFFFFFETELIVLFFKFLIKFLIKNCLVSRIFARSENYEMDLHLDIHCELYPLGLNQKFTFVLTKTVKFISFYELPFYFLIKFSDSLIFEWFSFKLIHFFLNVFFFGIVKLGWSSR